MPWALINCSSQSSDLWEENGELHLGWTEPLIHLDCSNRNTIDWIIYKQQKLISHSSGDQGTGTVESGEGHLLGYSLLTSCFVLMWRKRQGSSLETLYKGRGLKAPRTLPRFHP